MYLYVTTEILHHSQLAFYEQASAVLSVVEGMPVPQENLSFVEQASCLLLTMVLFGELPGANSNSRAIGQARPNK